MRECDRCRALRVERQRAAKVKKALAAQCADCTATATHGVFCERCHDARVQAETPAPRRVIRCSRCDEPRHNAAGCPYSDAEVDAIYAARLAQRCAA